MRRLALVALAVAASALAAGCASGAAQAEGSSYKGFGAGHWPNASWHPYNSDSPFNRVVGPRVRVHPHSRELVRTVLSWGGLAPILAGGSNTSTDYGHPTYYARPSDPVFRLQPLMPWGRNVIRGMRIHIPDRARPAAGGDGHMTVVEPDGWEYDFWQVRSKPQGGGTLRFSWGGRLRIDGSGLGGKATAAHFGNLAGIIREPELIAGRIDHALFLILRCTASDRSFRFGTRTSRERGDGSFVYPAGHAGYACPPGVDAPPMGARFQLTMTPAQIAQLDVPGWKKAVLRALARYGGYVGDTGGPGFAVAVESGSTYTSFGVEDPLERFAQHHGFTRGEDGRYTFDLADGVDWTRYLRVIAPPARR